MPAPHVTAHLRCPPPRWCPHSPHHPHPWGTPAPRQDPRGLPKTWGSEQGAPRAHAEMRSWKRRASPSASCQGSRASLADALPAPAACGALLPLLRAPQGCSPPGAAPLLPKRAPALGAEGRGCAELLAAPGGTAVQQHRAHPGGGGSAPGRSSSTGMQPGRAGGTWVQVLSPRRGGGHRMSLRWGLLIRAPALISSWDCDGGTPAPAACSSVTLISLTSRAAAGGAPDQPHQTLCSCRGV